MAGYGLKSFLIAQSLNQIEKAYGTNNSILDNCHVRVSFASNDERTAKRVSDALGMATELRAMKNYAGHRLSPWLGHLMVSRQETARPLMTAGEVMQLPPDDEIVMIAGAPPIRAKKVRYYEDSRLRERVLPVPKLSDEATQPQPNGWSAFAPVEPAAPTKAEGPEDRVGPAAIPSAGSNETEGDSANGGLRREPGLEPHKDIAPEPVKTPRNEFDPELDDHAEGTMRIRAFRNLARQAAMDPGDGMKL
jgi:type IV secretion system protein VirD4